MLSLRDLETARKKLFQELESYTGQSKKGSFNYSNVKNLRGKINNLCSCQAKFTRNASRIAVFQNLPATKSMKPKNSEFFQSNCSPKSFRADLEKNIPVGIIGVEI